MGIAALATFMSQAQVKRQANLSVMKMTMDTGNAQALDILKMMQASIPAQEKSVDPNLGRKIDIKL